MATSILIATIFFSFLFICSVSSFSLPSSQGILEAAADVLSDSGHLSMALTLQLLPQTLVSQSSASTIFAPSDAAFIQSGQPSLIQLQYHISPFRFPIKTLKYLPYGTIIPTALSNYSLFITSSPSDPQLSINEVNVSESSIYDDEWSLIIYAVEDFFNYSFRIDPISSPLPSPSSISEQSSGIASQSFDNFTGASDLLRSRGYNRMSAFLDMQLVWLGFTNQTKLTVFAPVDDEIDEYAKRNFSDYSSAFKRHVVPDWLCWGDLVRVYNVTTLKTFMEGFSIEVRRSGDLVELNGVPIIFPDMYFSDWIVVHGLNQTLVSRPKYNQY